MVTDDEDILEDVLREILQVTSKIDFNNNAPYMGRIIHRRVKELTNCSDPYKEVKERFNQAAMEQYDKLKEMIIKSDNPFLAAIKVSIAGNIIDFGVRADITEKEVKETIEDCLNHELVFNSAEELKMAVNQADRILFLGDNAGEIVFDKLLLQTMPVEKITYVVKGRPIINDATIEDAIKIKMNEVVRVIDNGSDVPGTILELCSPEFNQEYEKADLIIAKGQGNYETLSEVRDKEIFFLLKVKCPVIARDIGCEVGDIVLKQTREGE
jgi:hypothetical protein